MHLIALILFLFSSLHAAEENMPYKYSMTVCSIFQDEAEWLPEWIEFHLKQGVEHFYLYNNQSTDNYREILDSYISSGVVEVIEWNKDSTSISDFTIVQCGAYQDCLEKIAKIAKWCAIIDTDEFLFSVNGEKLPETLEKYSNFPGVGVNWACYGTSGVQKIPRNKKMVETLLLRAPLDFTDNYYYKSIVRPSEVAICDSPHFCKYKKGRPAVTENKKSLGNTHRTKKVSLNILRINHYWARDLDFFYNVKIDRWIKWGKPYTESIDKERQMNAVFDDILLHIPQ